MPAPVSRSSTPSPGAPASVLWPSTPSAPSLSPSSTSAQPDSAASHSSKAAPRRVSDVRTAPEYVLRMPGLSDRQRHLYAAWTYNYVRSLTKMGPRPEPSPETLEAFLSGLKGRGVPESQRSEAREALTFVHDVVLRVPVSRSKTDVDLSDGEKREVLARLTGADRVMARLVLESDLTPAEASQLRVGDLSGLRTGEALQATVCDAAGRTTRTEPLSADVLGELSVHLRHVRELFEHERAYGEARVPVPSRVEALFPDAAESWEWQFVFPAVRRRKDGRTGRPVRVSTDPSRVEATIASVQTAETRIFRLR